MTTNLAERLTYLERKLELLNQAVHLLDLGACSQCGKYFRIADRSARFEWRGSVCLDCLGAWWLRVREQLTVKDRDVAERRLVQWLLTHHGGKVCHQPPGSEDGQCNGLRIVAGCAQCDGNGQFGGSRCRGCHGRGAVWVVVHGGSGEGPQAVSPSGD